MTPPRRALVHAERIGTGGALLEALGELCRRLGTVHRKRGHEIRHLPDLGQGDGLDLGVVTGEPPGRRALVAARVLAHDQAQ